MTILNSNLNFIYKRFSVKIYGRIDKICKKYFSLIDKKKYSIIKYNSEKIIKLPIYNINNIFEFIIDTKEKKICNDFIEFNIFIVINIDTNNFVKFYNSSNKLFVNIMEKYYKNTIVEHSKFIKNNTKKINNSNIKNIENKHFKYTDYRSTIYLNQTNMIINFANNYYDIFYKKFININKKSYLSSNNDINNMYSKILNFRGGIIRFTMYNDLIFNITPILKKCCIITENKNLKIWVNLLSVNNTVIYIKDVDFLKKYLMLEKYESNIIIISSELVNKLINEKLIELLKKKLIKLGIKRIFIDNYLFDNAKINNFIESDILKNLTKWYISSKKISLYIIEKLVRYMFGVNLSNIYSRNICMQLYLKFLLLKKYKINMCNIIEKSINIKKINYDKNLIEKKIDSFYTIKLGDLLNNKKIYINYIKTKKILISNSFNIGTPDNLIYYRDKVSNKLDNKIDKITTNIKQLNKCKEKLLDLIVNIDVEYINIISSKLTKIKSLIDKEIKKKKHLEMCKDYHKKINYDSFECSICYNEVDKDNEIYGVTKCGHIFCMECLFESLYYKKMCPVCRNNIKITDIDIIYYKPENVLNKYLTLINYIKKYNNVYIVKQKDYNDETLNDITNIKIINTNNCNNLNNNITNNKIILYDLFDNNINTRGNIYEILKYNFKNIYKLLAYYSQYHLFDLIII
jgi:hypothetical protein